MEYKGLTQPKKGNESHGTQGVHNAPFWASPSMLHTFYFLLFPLILSTLYLILSAPLAHAGIKPPPSNLGLVGYWSMDDCRSAKATDFSGSGNTGALTNFALSSALPGWVTGNAAKRGCALNFDGVDDYVDMGTAQSASPTAAFSVSVWVKTTQIPGVNAPVFLVAKTDTTGANGYEMYLQYGAPYKATLWVDNAGVGDYSESNVAINDGFWHHIVGTFDGTNVRFYMDGVAQSRVGTSSGMGVNSNNTLMFGNRSRVLNKTPFSGSLDDVRIYNRALSATEVTALYNSGSAKLKAPDNTGLVGYWSFEDGRGSKATDFSGSGNAGTLTNFALSTSTSNWNTGNACKRGTCLNFDGVDDYVTLGDNFDNVIAGANKKFTISTWVNQDATIATTKEIVSKVGDGGSGGNERQFHYYVNNGKFLFIYYGDLSGNSYRGFQADTTTINPSNWYHIVVTYDGTLAYDSRASITINGIAQSLSIPLTLGSPDSIPDGAAPFTIGAARNTATVYVFNGKIDEVRIYNRALSATEVTSLYNSGAVKINASTASLQQGTNLASGLVGHWTFDGKYLNTTTSTDTSGSGNNGTLTGANGKPVPTAGKLGQALGFDGVDDYVETGNLSQINSVSGFTYSAWVYRTGAPSSYTGIVSRKEGAPAVPSTDLLLKTPSDIFFRVGVDQNSFGYTSSALIAINEWHHVVGVFDGSGSSNTDKLKIYVDGAQQSITTASTAPTSAPSMTANLTIGFYNQTPFYFPGKIDDVRVYNRALSASEVLQLYNLGR